MAPAERLTIERIGALAGVSRSTVSRVINGQSDVAPDVRQRVMDIVAATGYAPNSAARTLAGNRSRIIGLAIPETTQMVFSDPFFSHLIRGVSRSCNRAEQTLALFLFHETSDETHLLDRVVRTSLVDGLVVPVSHLDDPLIGRLLDRDIPFVLVGEHASPMVSFVDSDNQHGGAAAVEHLLELGRRRIATVAGPHNNSAARARLVGYERALGAAGLPVHRELVVEGDFTEGTAHDLTVELLAHEPDAIFAASDTMALGVIRALRSAGLRIPDAVAVVGFDDLPAAEAAGLTTVRQHVEHLGELAVRSVLDLLDDGEGAPPRRTTLPVELVVRASTVGDDGAPAGT
jgi:LacI family transcriptional regulator